MAFEARVVDVLTGFVNKFKPLRTQANLSSWRANITGSEADFKAREDDENRINQLLSDAALFGQLGALRASPEAQLLLEDGRHLRRQLDVAWLLCLDKQAPEELLRRATALSCEVERLFNTFRAKTADGSGTLTENDIRRVLRESHSSAEVEHAWKAYHQVGALVEPKLRELIALRNEVARGLGYSNYHDLQLATQEFDGAELCAMLDALDERTRPAFERVKSAIDAKLVKRFGLSAVADLRPWHYLDLFFQAAPSLPSDDAGAEAAPSLDELLKGKNVVETALKYYDAIGLGATARDVVSRSDLHEREGKCPHAFETDIDHEGDVRILVNVVDNEYWASTCLHELGHGLYSKLVDPETPWLLRSECHIFTTEAVAMFFGRLTKSNAWLSSAAGVPRERAEAAAKAAVEELRAEQLIFSRWVQVMFRFERAMYEDPSQDLCALWWRLKEKYQLLPGPGRCSPDYAAKIHIVVCPVYYHNYMLGELLASQFYSTLAEKGQGSLL
eukprot:m51a1_g6733 putative peptidase m3a and m3b thimet oligopeptidase f (503) ;mRNA; f:196632-199949